MTNAEILSIGLTQFTSALYPESLQVAARHARIQDWMARKNVMTTQRDIQILRTSPTPSAAVLHGMREVLRQQLRALRMHRKVRAAIVKVNRLLGAHRTKSTRIEPNKGLKAAADALATVIVPHLIPPQLYTVSNLREGLRVARPFKDSTTEHIIAEDWLNRFPELFFSFSLNPPLCVPPTGVPTAAQNLYNTIVDNMILTKTEERMLHQALTGRAL